MCGHTPRTSRGRARAFGRLVRAPHCYERRRDLSRSPFGSVFSLREVDVTVADRPGGLEPGGLYVECGR